MPSPSASSSPPARRTLGDRLLNAAELPGLHEDFSWETGETRRTEGEPFGTCHKYAMTSIGAMRVVVREFRPAPGSAPATSSATAGHLVAEFPDETTAQRAAEVLRSWRGQCAEELSDYRRHDVGALRPVSAPGASASWFLLTYGPVPGGSADDGYIDAQGITRVGKRVSVLKMRDVGQDYHYPAGKEPVAAAVRAASAKLG